MNKTNHISIPQGKKVYFLDSSWRERAQKSQFLLVAEGAFSPDFQIGRTLQFIPRSQSFSEASDILTLHKSDLK